MKKNKCMFCGLDEDTMEPTSYISAHFSYCDDLKRLQIKDGVFKDIKFNDVFITRCGTYVQFSECSWSEQDPRRPRVKPKKYKEAKSIFDLGDLWHMSTGYMEHWRLDGTYHEGYMDKKGSGPNYDIVSKLKLTKKDTQLIHIFYGGGISTEP